MIRENPAVLVDDPKREIRTFRLILGAPMGSKRGQGRGSFVTSVLDLLDGFYEDVIQGIKPWSAAPPRLRPNVPEPREPTVPAALASTSMSSQDGADPSVTGPKTVSVVVATAVAGPVILGSEPETVNDGAGLEQPTA